MSLVTGIPASCYEQYGEALESWYLQNYGSKINAQVDAGYAKECILTLTAAEITKPELIGDVFYNLMKRKGATTYAAATCKTWIANTIESFMSRCAKGKTETHECYSDKQCWEIKGSKDWRCRNHECIPYEYVEYDPDKPPIWDCSVAAYRILHPIECSGQSDPTPSGPCPRGRQYQAPLIGGCEPGYYREKRWGRDLCICEEGASAETSLDKLGDYLSGNLKMILIVIVVIVLGLVVMKVASKKVSVG